jgi:hypothetical protein
MEIDSSVSIRIFINLIKNSTNSLFNKTTLCINITKQPSIREWTAVNLYKTSFNSSLIEC